MVRQAKIAEANAVALQKAKQIAELDVLGLQLDVQRSLTDLEVSHRDWIAAWRRLVANIGLPNMPVAVVQGKMEGPLPDFDLTEAKSQILENHPDVQIARVGITKADLALRRAEVEKIPNLTFGTGYTGRDRIDPTIGC